MDLIIVTKCWGECAQNRDEFVSNYNFVNFESDTIICLQVHALERTQLVKITVREFLDDILNTNSMHIIVR